MSVLDKLEEKATGIRHRSDFQDPLQMTLVTQDTGSVRGAGFGAQHGFVLVLKLAVSYWANTAQEIQAQRDARRVLAQYLYADIHLPLALLRSAITGGDRQAAIQAVGMIEDAIK